MGLKVSNCASCFALFVLLVLMTLPSSPIIAQLNSDECLVRTNGGFTTKQALRVGNLSNQTSNLGFEAWENTSALNLVDRSYATSNIPAWNRSHKLHFNNFNFNIPTGAVIEGIQVIMYGKADTLGRPRDFQLFLTDGSGNPKGNNKANQAIVGTPWDGIDIDSSMGNKLDSK